MVFLRNVFVQTCNSNYSFSNLFGGFSSCLSSYFTNDNNEQLNNCNTDNTLKDVKSSQTRSIFIKNTTYMLSYQKYIYRLINLHINSLKDLIQNDKTDFSGLKDFTHILELEEDDWSLDDVQTVVSVSFDAQGEQQNSQNSTKEDINIIFDDESEHSQVEDNYF